MTLTYYGSVLQSYTENSDAQLDDYYLRVKISPAELSDQIIINEVQENSYEAKK